MEELIRLMKVALATSHAYQLKAQYYHWNVEGPNFPQYHDLFGKIYGDVYGSLDQFAEEIRALGAYAPGSHTRYAELSIIQEENMIPDSLTMADRLLSDTYIVIEQLNSVFETSEQNKKYGLSDFIAGRIDMMNKWAWQLRATTKTPGLTTT